MLTALFGSFESGVIYAIMALGVYLSFRTLDFPDLTVDGSFVTGAAICAKMILSGYNPFLATFFAIIAGVLAGFITGILHTKGKINPLLSGILVMIALYSINLRIMGKANLPLLDDSTIFTDLAAYWQSLNLDHIVNTLFSILHLGAYTPKTWSILISLSLFTYLIKKLIDKFLATELGLAIRATGNNKAMMTSFSGNTDNLTILGLGLSNGLIALSGALIAQYDAFADVGMGIGMIIIGLASVIIGEALFGTKTIARTTLAVIGGSIVYRIVVAFALRFDFLDTGDMKLVTAVLVIIALVTPKIIVEQKKKFRKIKKRTAIKR